MVKVTRKINPNAKFLKQAIKDLQTLEARAGWGAEAKYPKTGTPVAYVAAINEYGDPSHNIPPRPFIRPTKRERGAHWNKIMATEMSRVIKGQTTVRQALETLVLVAAGDIKATIRTITEPELKDSTVAARARKLASGKITESLKKPLIETKYLFNSLTGVVEKKK